MYMIDKIREAIQASDTATALANLDRLAHQISCDEERRNKDSEKEYWETVEAAAKEIVDGGYDIDAQVDGNYWVIYYHAAHKVWQYSPNEDAVFTDGEGLGDCTSMGEVLTRMAYHAFRADVQCKVDELQAEKDAAEEEDDEDDDEDEGEEEA